MKLNDLRCGSGFYKDGATAYAQVWTDNGHRIDAGINYRCDAINLLRPDCVPLKDNGKRLGRMIVVVRNDDRETILFITAEYGRYPDNHSMKIALDEKEKPELQWHAEWIPYMKSYRVYDPKKPQDTIAYVDDLDEAREQAREEQNAHIVLCDADTMHVECY